MKAQHMRIAAQAHDRCPCAWALAVACVAMLAAAFAPLAAAKDPESVVLQLNWKHQFQFAGYYVAIERGYYRDAGFAVTLREPGAEEDPIALVLAGKAAFGIGASELALRRGQGEPVVALMTVLQHSPLVLLTGSATIPTVQDLAGRRVMLMPHETELFAYLSREGVPRATVRELPHSFDPTDLVAGKVDAISAYATDEPFQLKSAGFTYNAFSPRASGIDFYADTLFTSEQRARQYPERVEAFREASIRGWQYAMNHPEETADLILGKYSRRHTREHLLFEAEEMRKLMQPQLVEIGHMNPGRWQHIAGVYAEIGMLPPGYTLDGFVFDPNARVGQWRSWWWLAVAALAVALAGIVVLRRKSLMPAFVGEADPDTKARLEEIRTLRAPLHAQAMRDPLTGLYSRDYVADALGREIANARRRRESVSALAVSVHDLAALADSYGPHARDALLRALATELGAQARPEDIAGHLDAQAFVLVLPAIAASEARTFARALSGAFRDQRVKSGPLEIAATLDTGLAAFPDDALDAAGLLAAARRALAAAR